MLVLGRQVDEVIRIGDDIKIMVVRIAGDKIRIGVDAPGMSIHREEVYQAIQREARQVAEVAK